MQLTPSRQDRTGEPEFRQKYGPWALVTGASEGIGREFARRLARAGLHVALVARRGDALERLANELRADFGIEAEVLPADLADPAALSSIAARTTHLDIGLLVAAAGFGTSGLFVESPLEDELQMIDVNCRAVACLAHLFGRRMVLRGRGGLVLLSSVVAFQGVPRAANYSATKAYVQSLAEGLFAELRPLGIDVIASAPGPIHSGFAKRAGMTLGLAETPEAVAQATLDCLGRRSLTRPGRLAKLLGWSLALLPRSGRVRVMSLVMAGMARRGSPVAESPAG
jgi:short-subunit dehydrogenase